MLANPPYNSAVGNTKQVDGDSDPNDYLKSYYSSYGVGATDVTAPGGDFYYGRGTDGGSDAGPAVTDPGPVAPPVGGPNGPWAAAGRGPGAVERRP